MCIQEDAAWDTIARGEIGKEVSTHDDSDDAAMGQHTTVLSKITTSRNLMGRTPKNNSFYLHPQLGGMYKHNLTAVAKFMGVNTITIVEEKGDNAEMEASYYQVGFSYHS